MGKMATFTGYHQSGPQTVEMIPKRVVDGRLTRLDREGDKTAVVITDLIDVALEREKTRRRCRGL